MISLLITLVAIELIFTPRLDLTAKRELLLWFTYEKHRTYITLFTKK